jgi:hypothetical protein
MLLEAVGGVLQAVVDVHRPHLPWPLHGAGCEQCGGVGAAAEGYCQGESWGEGGEGLEEC